MTSGKDRPPPGPHHRSAADPEADTQRMRRGGPRTEASERVVFHGEGRDIEGWTLNVSRGGLRAILEEPVEVGAEFEVAIGESGLRRSAQVKWVQKERDGVIVGLSFLPAAPSEEAQVTTARRSETER